MSFPRPEHELLSRAVLVGSQPATVDPLNGVRWEEIDWDYAVRTADRVGSLALLGVALARNGIPRPPDVDQRCRQARIRGALRSLVAERILSDIIAGFSSAGIEFMVLKGLPLAQELYGEPGLRPMDDLDILVHRQSRARALEVMLGLGYRLPSGSLSPRFYLRHHFHLLMVRRIRTGLPVELHWNTQPFFSPSIIPEKEFWEGRRTCNIGSVDVTVPGREQEFLYLIQHLSRHLLGWGPEVAVDPVGVFLDPARRGRLTWLADLLLLSGAEPLLDRDRMARLAERWFMVDEMRSALSLIDGIQSTRSNAGSAPWSAPPRRRKHAVIGRLWARKLPWLAHTSPTLHFRPLLALHVLGYAFPGSRLIRHRYGDHGRIALGFHTIYHAVDILFTASRIGLSYLIEICLKPFRRHRFSLPRA